MIGPTGKPLTFENLPPPETERWVIRRKAEVVAAVHTGLIGLDEACERYRLSTEEFLNWEQLIESHGMRGLRVTRTQAYRQSERNGDRREGQEVRKTMPNGAMKKVSKVFPEPVHAPARYAMARSPFARPSKRSLARDEGGAVAVMLALMLAALIGMMGLAMDLGKVWNLETQLQHAADAGALAGVTQLDGTDGARVRAIRAVVSGLANNTQIFASDNVDADGLGGPDGSDIEFDTTETIDGGSGKATNRDIKFYTILPIDPANESTSDDDARFIQVTVWPRTATFSFAAVIGAVSSASPGARAVAGWESLYCDAPPMMMCNPNEDPAGDANAPFNLYTDCPNDGDGNVSCVGRGITMKARAAFAEPGDFGYLALQVLNADGTISEPKGKGVLAEAMASVDYGAVCTGNSVTTEPGNAAVLDQYINQRFDIYPDLASALDANRQPAPNVGRGLTKKASFDPANGKCKYSPQSPADPGDWQKPKGPGGESTGYRGPGKHARVDDLAPFGVPDANLDPDADPSMGLVAPYIRAMAYPKDTCNFTFDQTDVAAFEAIHGPLRAGAGACLFRVPPSDPTPKGRQMGNAQWEAQIYLDVYHPDLAAIGVDADYLVTSCVADPDDPYCADALNNSADPGSRDGRLSRWELYNWEKRYDAANDSYPNMAFEEEPLCYRAPEDYLSTPYPDPVVGDYTLPEAPAGPSKPDRRIMVMAVINCVAMGNGRRTVDRTKPHGNVAVFMTEPMGYTVPDTLYGELVDPLGLGNSDVDTAPSLVRERIVLIE